MQRDSSPEDLRVGGWVPTQRTDPDTQVLPPNGETQMIPPTSGPPAPGGKELPPTTPQAAAAGHAANDETMVLPVFVTGKKPEPPPTRAEQNKLPPSERGMLLFVAALLGIGTIAVVAMMGFGLVSTPSKPHARPSAAAASPSVQAAPAPVESPSPTPSVPLSHKPVHSTTSSPKRSPSPNPTATFLGSLSMNDVSQYCVAKTGSPSAHPPSGDNHFWTCGRRGQAKQPFTPTDVCRSASGDGGALAQVGSIDDPRTWRCYT